MDYLPHPKVALDHVKVPLLQRLEFDGLEFWSFPARCGFTDDYNACSPDSLASLLQAWLYFGVLEIFLKRRIDQSTFKEQTPAGAFVSARGLRKLLDEWLAVTIMPVLGLEQAAKTSEESIEELRSQCLASQEFLENVFKHAHKLEALPQSRTGPLPEIFLSIKILVTSLSGVWRELMTPGVANRVEYQRENLSPVERLCPLTATPDQTIFPSVQIILDDMASHHWCPSAARKICRTFNYALAYYISRIPGRCQPSHDNCSEDTCVAYNVDMKKYATRHTSQDCTCSHVSVDEARVQSIIADGGVPLVALRKTKSGHCELAVTKLTHHTNYVAFSHVWSDGLGNPSSNSLPLCQLQLLTYYYEHLETPGVSSRRGIVNWGVPRFDFRRMTRDLKTRWFWLDTLCIPVGEQHQDLKHKAINQMAAIYAGASQVLVLDSRMQGRQINEPGLEACELLARTYAMPWMGRSWTFQEGAIATMRQIQCSGQSFDPGDVAFGPGNVWLKLVKTGNIGAKAVVFVKMLMLAARVSYHRSSFEHAVTIISPDIDVALVALLSRPLKDAILEQFNVLYTLRSGDPLTSYERFVLCWNALRERTTTKKEDIHLIIANLIGFNPSVVANLQNPADRMVVQLMSLPYVPLSIFFDPTIPRAHVEEQTSNNRWVPLYPKGGNLELEPTVDVLETGLRLKSSSLDNSDPVSPEHKSPSVFTLYESGSLQGPSSQVITLRSKKTALDYELALHREDGITHSAPSPGSTACLVFESNTLESGSNLAIDPSSDSITNPIRGALFWVLGHGSTSSSTMSSEKTLTSPQVWPSGNSFLRVTFDCTVTAKLVPSARSEEEKEPTRSTDEASMPCAELLEAPWCLDIQVGKKPFFPIKLSTHC